MGTIAARDCLRVLELTEQVAAALVMASIQGVELRRQTGQPAPGAACASFCENVRQHVDFLDEDRPVEHDLRRLTGLIRQQTWTLYD
jgi:histidine ammonia-lyase